MKKELTPEQVQLREEKRAKELLRWERVAGRPQIKNYLLILMIVLTVVYVVDEITSNIGSAIQPYVIFELFKIPNADILSPEYDVAMGKMAIITIPTMMFLVFAPFYKSLADRYGRRLFLAINTLAMGIGMLICMVAPNFFIYAFGMLVMAFVTPNDVQVMYIMEVAPKKHRAKLCSITKAIALVSVSLIGVFRGIFYDPAVITSWRRVFIIPVATALIVGALSVFFVKETPVFLKERIEYLRAGDENLLAKAAQKGEKNGGVIKAIKYIFSHKQTRATAIAALIFAAAAGVTSYYATILEAANGTGAITSENITQIIIFFPFINGVITFIGGFFTDSMGRKRASVLLGALAAIGLAAFVAGARLGWNQYIIGAAYGLFIGGLWSVSDILFLVLPAESTPTELRASVMGTMSLMLVLGMLVSNILIIVGQLVVGAENIGLLSLCVCLPLMLAALVILMTRVRETKDVDLDAISADEQ